jgi:predicted transcriptional regulator
MNLVRRTLELDAETDTRLAEIAAERGQEIATVLAEAVALLDSVLGVLPPDVEEDRRRLHAFRATGQAVPLDEIKAWIASWDSPTELPRPTPRKIG